MSADTARMIDNVLRRVEAGWRSDFTKSLSSREMYLPTHARDVAPIVPEGTDLAIYKILTGDRLTGVAFAGKSNKPLWHYRFRSDAEFDKTVEETAKNRRLHFQRKEDDQRARKEWSHGLQEGDILYASWGYDQTNVDFYQIVSVQDKTVMLREIASEGTKNEYVIPVPGKFIGPPMRKLPRGRGTDPGSVRLTSYSSAYKWDGNPKYVTPGHAGH
jgi:hypothetical protein